MEHPGVEAVPRSTIFPRLRVSAVALVGLVVAVSAVVRIIAGAAKSTPDYFVDEYRYLRARALTCRDGTAARSGSGHALPGTAPASAHRSGLAARRHVGRVCRDQARGSARDVACRDPRLPPCAPARPATVFGLALLRRRGRPTGDALLLLGPRRAVRIPARTRSRRSRFRGARRRGAPQPHRVRALRRRCDPCPRSVRRTPALLRPRHGRRRSQTTRAARRVAPASTRPRRPRASNLRCARCSHPSILGFYSNFNQVSFDAGWLAGRLGANGFILLFTAGWVVVPGALFGLGLALARPRSRSSSASALCRAC